MYCEVEEVIRYLVFVASLILHYNTLLNQLTSQVIYFISSVSYFLNVFVIILLYCFSTAHRN